MQQGLCFKSQKTCSSFPQKQNGKGWLAEKLACISLLLNHSTKKNFIIEFCEKTTDKVVSTGSNPCFPFLFFMPNLPVLINAKLN